MLEQRLFIDLVALYYDADTGEVQHMNAEWPFRQRFVEVVRAEGGKVSMEDMKRYEVMWSEALPLAYRDYEWVFGVNVGGVLNGMRAFAQRFLASERDAWIVNTGSEHSFGVPHLGAGLYTVSKHAVLGGSDIARRELAGRVGVSVLCPGIVESELWRSSERRPDALGGAVPAPKETAVSMRFGLPAKEIAERTMQAIENESFYVLTHPHVVDIARQRWKEARDAFADQAPRYEGDEAYAVPNIIKRLAADS